MICRECGKERTRIKTDRKHGVKKPKYVYVDERGGVWSKRLCPPCFKISKVRASRVNGAHRDRDKQVRPEHRLGYDNEVIALAYLKTAFPGEVFVLGSGKGPDIIMNPETTATWIEVKTVSQDSRSGHLYVNRLSKAGRKSDYIVLVYPDKKCLFESMTTYLMNCAPSGSRGRNL